MRIGSCTKYIFAGGQRVALKPVGSTSIYYYHTDHLGSSSVVTNAAGTKVQSLAYYPYGKTRASTGSIDVHHKYTSQELDDSTGLYFYNARYYDPVLGRFISPDSIIPNPHNPQALNRYSYVLNNPLNLIDPSGHSFKDWWKKEWRKVAGAVVVVATIAVAVALPNPITIGAAIGSTAGYGRALIVGGDPLMGAVAGAGIGAAIGAGFYYGCPGCTLQLGGAAGSGSASAAISICFTGCSGSGIPLASIASLFGGGAAAGLSPGGGSSSSRTGGSGGSGSSNVSATPVAGGSQVAWNYATTPP